jgi:hypothetical protein
MNLTSLDIFRIIYEWVEVSFSAEGRHTRYEDHYPRQALNRSKMGEFVVLNVLSNSVGDGQTATINVNIYVPDTTEKIKSIEQRYPNHPRLAELSRIAYDSLKGYPVTERWFFDISSEVILKDEDIPYSFANIRLTLKRF